MLTIKKIGASEKAVSYYAEYAQEKGEKVGTFVDYTGRLGLHGKEVQPETLTHLLLGYDPNGQAGLVKKPGPDHHPGWDLTFSPPKSVSISWSNADDDLRLKIEAAQDHAVQAALTFINQEAGFTRTGAGGRTIEKANLVFSLFQHSSNRATEPQLHTHALLLNVSKTVSDGQWRTINPIPVYRAYMAAGAVYKAEMAHQLRLLGLEVERTKDSFELTMVPKNVAEAQSSRSKAIEEELAKSGLSRAHASARAKESLALGTRRGKGLIVRDFERWQRENADQGFGSAEQRAALDWQHAGPTPENLTLEEQAALAEATTAKLTNNLSTFGAYQFHRQIAEASIGLQGAAGVSKTIEQAKISGYFLTVKDGLPFAQRFSTREMLAIERDVMDLVAARRGEGRHVLSEAALAAGTTSRSLSDEQRAAFDHVTTTPEGVAFIEGDAGTGKSYLMSAVRTSYEHAGYQVQGLSFTNKAAQGLEAGSGIRSRSADSFIYAYERDPDKALPKNAVIVLDEAGMLDSRKTKKLLEIARDRGAKVIAIGDQKQIQPIGAGQAFGTLGKTFSAKRLSNIIRQHDPVERAAVHALAEGQTKIALDLFDSKNLLRIHNTRHDARHAMIDEWQKEGIDKSGARALMVVTTNAEVAVLNAMARQRLVETGALGKGVLLDTAHGTETFAAGDTIIFTDNFKKKGILNSTLARIEKIDPVTKTVTAMTETKRRVRFNVATMDQFRHGYAITAHKSQGSTVERVMVLADGPQMDREKLYVAMSRGRSRNTLFVDRTTIGDLTPEQGEKLSELAPDERAAAERKAFKENLARVVGQSHKKDTTHDYEEPLQAFLGSLDQPASQAPRASLLGEVQQFFATAKRRIARQAEALFSSGWPGQDAPAHEPSRAAREKPELETEQQLEIGLELETELELEP